MKKTLKFKFVLVLLFSINNAYTQTCKLESEVPSTTPNSRFADNGNATITDYGTGLMWQKCQLGLSGGNCATGAATTHTWQQALDESQSSTVAGYYDWRLPNHKELLSIIEQRCKNPSINTTYFPNTSISYFWSASPYVTYPESALFVYFGYGYSYYSFRSSDYSVRLVRFGQ